MENDPTQIVTTGYPRRNSRPQLPGEASGNPSDSTQVINPAAARASIPPRSRRHPKYIPRRRGNEVFSTTSSNGRPATPEATACIVKSSMKTTNSVARSRIRNADGRHTAIDGQSESLPLDMVGDHELQEIPTPLVDVDQQADDQVGVSQLAHEPGKDQRRAQEHLVELKGHPAEDAKLIVPAQAPVSPFADHGEVTWDAQERGLQLRCPHPCSTMARQR
jgi:hypothetical protein